MANSTSCLEDFEATSGSSSSKPVQLFLFSGQGLCAEQALDGVAVLAGLARADDDGPWVLRLNRSGGFAAVTRLLGVDATTWLPLRTSAALLSHEAWPSLRERVYTAVMDCHMSTAQWFALLRAR